MAYAKGKYAVGQCARSGRKMLRKHMVRDGYYPDLIVDPAWREPVDPQERFVGVDDPIAIAYPAPDLYVDGLTLTYPLYDVVTGRWIDTAQIRPQCYDPDFSLVSPLMFGVKVGAAVEPLQVVRPQGPALLQVVP